VLYPHKGSYYYSLPDHVRFFVRVSSGNYFIILSPRLTVLVRIVDQKDSACSLSQNQRLRPAHTTEPEAEPDKSNVRESSSGRPKPKEFRMYCQVAKHSIYNRIHLPYEGRFSVILLILTRVLSLHLLNKS